MQSRHHSCEWYVASSVISLPFPSTSLKTWMLDDAARLINFCVLCSLSCLTQYYHYRYSYFPFLLKNQDPHTYPNQAWHICSLNLSPDFSSGASKWGCGVVTISDLAIFNIFLFLYYDTTWLLRCHLRGWHLFTYDSSRWQSHDSTCLLLIGPHHLS